MNKTLKKGLLIGLMLGVIMAIYSNITSCHPVILGGGMEGCNNSFQVALGLFEFLLYFPLASLAGFLGVPLGGDFSFRILLIISPLLFFGLVGIIISFLVKAFNQR